MDTRELRTLEYSPEREREELMAQAEQGRRYRVANDVLDEIFFAQREHVIRQLESADLHSDNDAIGLVQYLRVLKIFVDTIRSRIDSGEIAEKELINDGD